MLYKIKKSHDALSLKSKLNKIGESLRYSNFTYNDEILSDQTHYY